MLKPYQQPQQRCRNFSGPKYPRGGFKGVMKGAAFTLGPRRMVIPGNLWGSTLHDQGAFCSGSAVSWLTRTLQGLGRIGLYCLAAGGLCTLAVAAPRSSRALVPAPNSRIDSVGIRSACGQPPGARCHPRSTTAWVPRGASRHAPVYLIDTEGPRLLRLEGHDLLPTGAWDFSGYEHSWTEGSGSNVEGDAKLAIYPALYPVGTTGDAVAILRHGNTMYSGGWASFEVADFVALDSTPPETLIGAAPTVLYRSVPFSCEQMIRACFSEKDYAEKKDNCHDSYTGSLRITFPSRPTTSSPSWRFAWSSDGEPAKPFMMPDQATPDAPWPVSFCGEGPP